MKVISLLQPWATLVVIGAKKIETRSWNTKYRGPLLIHASQKIFKPIKGMENLMVQMTQYGFWEKVEHMQYGAIIGQVNILDTFPTNMHQTSDAVFSRNKRWDLTKQEEAFGDYSPGRFGWLLANPFQFDTPIPVKGKLGLWEYDYKPVETEKPL